MDKFSNVRMEQHNQDQKIYFGRRIKKTMIPLGSAYLRRHVHEVVRCANLQAEERVLEIGCGMGRYTLILAEQGFHIEGLDLSPEILNWLGQFNAGRYAIPLHNADILSYPPQLAGRFDALISFFTLHHLHDLEASFQAMGHLLKPGGRLAFVEPNPYNPLYYIQITVTPGMSWRAEKGFFQMRPLVIFQAMKKTGFHSFKFHRFGFFPPFLANTTRGANLERILEAVPFWRAMLPFQFFYGEME